MRGWEELGVVDTIYEDDQEEEEEGDEEEDDESFNSLSLTLSTTTTPTPPQPSSVPPSFPAPRSLQSKVEAWSKATGCKTDVVIRVHDQSFHLHREPLSSRSGYFKRQLAESSDVCISPPSSMTPETFTDVATFCYGSDVVLTPFNLAAIRVSAEWLEMAAEYGGGLIRRTESYFFQEVAVDAGHAAVVLHSCEVFLTGEPSEAAASANLAVKCIEVLDGSEESGGDGWLGYVAALSPEKLQLITESMRARFPHDHDLIYRVVDHYLDNHEGKLTEEYKTRMCYTIDSAKLSHHLLMHLVQNPRLPLRFVVQAMLVEQLHTRHSIIDRAAASAAAPLKPSNNHHSNRANDYNQLTLGAILQRDAAIRQSAHIRATMEATSLRIQSLEQDLANLRQRLRWSEEKQTEMESTRSASFRILRHNQDNIMAVAENGAPEVVGQAGRSCNGNPVKSNSGKGLGWRLVRGFKNIFRKSGGGGPGGGSGVEGNTTGSSENAGGAWEEVVALKEKLPEHRRNRSFS